MNNPAEISPDQVLKIAAELEALAGDRTANLPFLPNDIRALVAWIRAKAADNSAEAAYVALVCAALTPAHKLAQSRKGNIPQEPLVAMLAVRIAQATINEMNNPTPANLKEPICERLPPPPPSPGV